ncbi:nascent polypeptide-associated complex subunit alpha-like [Drosophila serrata]|uniref:nascent polypeptide-associated complex subunit alpha-like n=1 Tax=Drosophila serrata TaxID=7274 RepID=UPI000A1D2596|nr:nascent polypeptide-associated complex subunit alpha-like [Drosophila serrata]
MPELTKNKNKKTKAASSTSNSGEAKPNEVRVGDVGSDTDSNGGTPNLQLNQIGGGNTGLPFQLITKGKQSRGEKKARKIILKLGLKPILGVNRVTIRKSKNILFVINNPDVYKNPHTDTYIIFGEPKVEDLSKQAKMAAAEKFKAVKAALPMKPTTVAKPLAPIVEKEEEEVVDATGVDEKDIELVQMQANTTRSQAVKALKKNNNDLVNAIMDLTLT